MKRSPGPSPITLQVREVFDISQASDYLGITADTLYRYASTGFIPAFKLGNRWRFRRTRIDEWIDKRSAEFSKTTGEKKFTS
jgi:excisionase family DNA binding protein